MAPSHIVVRRFPGPGGRSFEPGDQVHALDWRNVETLEAQRYLRPLLASDVPGPEREAGRGGRHRREA